LNYLRRRGSTNDHDSFDQTTQKHRRWNLDGAKVMGQCQQTKGWQQSSWICATVLANTMLTSEWINLIVV
jgi:hypothetical protein